MMSKTVIYDDGTNKHVVSGFDASDIPQQSTIESDALNFEDDDALVLQKWMCDGNTEDWQMGDPVIDPVLKTEKPSSPLPSLPHPKP